MSLTPEQRSMRARIAANARWSREDPGPNTARARAGLLASFEREVDPDGILAPAERARRAECARKAHMIRMAFASSRARSARRAAGGGSA